MQASPALAAGAHDCVPTNEVDEAELWARVRALSDGVAPLTAPTRQRSALSPRELDVLHLVAHGFTDRGIGIQLGISIRTVQSHLDRIREKSGRRRRAELTALAYELGIDPKYPHADCEA
jgi:DNA-binding NarL/FixJ family response regulator